MSNAGSSAVSLPSLTRMTMSTCTPSAAAVGVPESRPVVELKDAQGGLLVMLKLSVAPSGSDAAGVKP
jgi:hypothetical protein